MTVEKENMEAILRKVAKILAIAQDDRADPNEAAAAAGMAERIMRKYQLEQADVIMDRVKAGEDMATADCLATAKTNGTKVKKVPPWADWLAVGIAKLNDLGAQKANDANGERVIRFFGYQSDVQVGKYMFDYLVATINRLANQYKVTPSYIVGGRSALHAYRQGVSMGILSQLNSLVASKKKEVQESTTGTALVVVKRQAITEKYGESIFGVTKGSSKIRRGDAYASGYRDGKNVDVNRRGISGQQSNAGLLA